MPSTCRASLKTRPGHICSRSVPKKGQRCTQHQKINQTAGGGKIKYAKLPLEQKYAILAQAVLNKNQKDIAKSFKDPKNFKTDFKKVYPPLHTQLVNIYLAPDLFSLESKKPFPVKIREFLEDMCIGYNIAQHDCAFTNNVAKRSAMTLRTIQHGGVWRFTRKPPTPKPYKELSDEEKIKVLLEYHLAKYSTEPRLLENYITKYSQGFRFDVAKDYTRVEKIANTKPGPVKDFRHFLSLGKSHVTPVLCNKKWSKDQCNFYKEAERILASQAAFSS